MNGKIVEFNGNTYVRNPKSNYYFRHTTRNAERRNSQQLHRAVWEYYNGPIPDGWQVHHIDGDVDNNDISNLQCLPAKEHLRHHARKNEQDPDFVARQIENLKAAQEAAKEWHGSPEGKEWHRKHVAESIGKVRENKIVKTCEFCGKQFDGMPWSRYCSESCGDKARRRKKGLKFEPQERRCLFCGNTFIAQKVNAMFCSVTCKNKQYWKNEKEKR